MKLACCLALGLIALVSTAQAETYHWIAPDGTHHFTQDATQVPLAHRGSARVGRAASPGGRAQGRSSQVGGRAEIPFESDGHLMKVMVRLNGRVSAPFYVDTGSTELVLPESVARRLGASRDRGTATLETAAGRIQVSTLRLDSVQVGGERVSNLFATVAPGLEVGLLGGAFLNKFRYAVDPVDQVLILTPRDADDL